MLSALNQKLDFNLKSVVVPSDLYRFDYGVGFQTNIM